MKKYHFPKWLGCAKKNFHFFQEKMDFWPFLRIFENHKNGQKSIFSWKKWKFFLAHPNHLGRWYFFIFYTFHEGQVKGAKNQKIHFCALLIFVVFGPKMGKKMIFLKKSFSNNFPLSIFGEKLFWSLFTKFSTRPCRSRFPEDSMVPGSPNWGTLDRIM